MSHCQTLIEALRLNGYRITPQREMIVEAIAHSDHHLSAEEIYEQVQTRTRYINIATIYRTLDLLVDEGLVSRIDIGDGRVLHATWQHGPHIHLVCRGCGCVIEADQHLLEPMGDLVREQYGFSPDLQHTSFLGLCEDCQPKNQV
jgi:Fur family ferric uptake transcriptional regulator